MTTTQRECAVNAAYGYIVRSQGATKTAADDAKAYMGMFRQLCGLTAEQAITDSPEANELYGEAWAKVWRYDTRASRGVA